MVLGLELSLGEGAGKCIMSLSVLTTTAIQTCVCVCVCKCSICLCVCVCVSVLYVCVCVRVCSCVGGKLSTQSNINELLSPATVTVFVCINTQEAVQLSADVACVFFVVLLRYFNVQ